MRNPFRRRSPETSLTASSTPIAKRARRARLARLESLERRDLMAVAPLPAVETASVVHAQAIANPTVAFVQLEPLTGRVLVSFSGDLAGYNLSTLRNPANYSFSPVASFTRLPSTPQSRPRAGVVLVPDFVVTGVQLSTPVAPGQPQSLIVTINNNQPIRNGIYQFAINGAGITDQAGRPLDGQYNGVFPSGNGTPGSAFIANLVVTHNTVQPARAVNPRPGTVPANAVVPTYVFFPTTQAIRTRYAPANRPGKFMLVGGNNITLVALNNQNFLGTFRPHLAKPHLLDASKKSHR